MNPVFVPLLYGLLVILSIGLVFMIGTVIRFEVYVPLRYWLQKRQQKRKEWESTKEFIKKL